MGSACWFGWVWLASFACLSSDSLFSCSRSCQPSFKNSSKNSLVYRVMSLSLIASVWAPCSSDLLFHNKNFRNLSIFVYISIFIIPQLFILMLCSCTLRTENISRHWQTVISVTACASLWHDQGSTRENTTSTRDKAVQSHSVYSNSYIISSYAARIMCWVSAPDAPMQVFKQEVRHYDITGRLFTRDKVV